MVKNNQDGLDVIKSKKGLLRGETKPKELFFFFFWKEKTQRAFL